MDPDPSYWLGKRVCVAGGTGLLGYQIVKRLRSLGAHVRVFALPMPDWHPLRGERGVEVIEGDVRDRAAVGRAVDGSDVVFHAAGVVAVWGPSLGRVREIHTTGTRNILGSVPRGTRVVVTSSVVTVGASLAQDVLNEDSPFGLDGLRIDYVHAKRAAERIALDFAEAGGDVVVVNPSYLVGPEDFEPSVIGRFCLRYWRGMVPFAPPGGVNLVDVRDAAVGHLLAAERGVSGRRYIFGGEDRTFSALMRDLAAVGGLRPVASPVLPAWGLMVLAVCGEGRSRLTRRHPYPSVQHARQNRYHWFYDSSRAARELGFESRPLADTLADAYAWFSGLRAVRPRGLSKLWMRPEAA